MNATQIMRVNKFTMLQLKHFVIENIYSDKMLWRCYASLRNAREIGAGGLCPPSSDNLKAKMLSKVRQAARRGRKPEY
jgi:hypothetical protein